MAVGRVERVVSIKRAIKDVMIQGLRDVFTTEYQDSAFKSLRVVHEYPQDPMEYPCIVVRWKGRRYPIAGVGHYEVFPDPLGVYRRWEHRRFEGDFEFEVASLSALERDKLSDALLEVLSFGTLTAALGGLLVRAYGDVNSPYNPMSLLFQINLNTDEPEEGGDSTDLAPWQTEDALIYTSSFTMETTGGYYNAIPSDPAGLQYIESAELLVYIVGDDLPFSVVGDPAQWVYTFSYVDDASVAGKGVISGVDVYTP